MVVVASDAANEWRPEGIRSGKVGGRFRHDHVPAEAKGGTFIKSGREDVVFGVPHYVDALDGFAMQIRHDARYTICSFKRDEGGETDDKKADCLHDKKH